MTSKVGTAALNHTTFAYETAGAGRPLVFIHAGIADSRMWDGQFSALAGSFKVVRYDMRGFGRTPPAEGSYAHHEDLAALLTHLGLGRVSLVGCSMGSKTALDFALQYPERVDRLVLSSPAVGGLAFDGPPPPRRPNWKRPMRRAIWRGSTNWRCKSGWTARGARPTR